MNIRLVSDWRTILTKAWSIRFTITSAIFSALEFIVPLIQPGEVQRGLFAGVAFIVSIGAAGARVLAQKEITNASPNSDQVAK